MRIEVWFAPRTGTVDGFTAKLLQPICPSPSKTSDTVHC